MFPLVSADPSASQRIIGWSPRVLHTLRLQAFGPVGSSFLLSLMVNTPTCQGLPY